MVADGVIDVVIPVYNGQRVVEACIESVARAKAYNRYEIVVVDDASTDPAVVGYLERKAADGTISLLKHPSNRGFSRSVNLGMQQHPDRDVILLNSDTVVYRSWADRMRACAYADARVGTTCPLTNAAHISNYPHRDGNVGVTLEISDETLDLLAQDCNAGHSADVYTTVGFCMFIKRACLNAVGLFDARNFPIGYGEETDFCFRARGLGWKHRVAGDVFVRHDEGQSFGDRKAALMRDMLVRFDRLHPGHGTYYEAFIGLDPGRRLRENLDIARILHRFGPLERLSVSGAGGGLASQDRFYLEVDEGSGVFALRHNTDLILPNLPIFTLPAQLPVFNARMTRLGVSTLVCDANMLERAAPFFSSKPEEVALQASVVSALTGCA